MTAAQAPTADSSIAPAVTRSPAARAARVRRRAQWGLQLAMLASVADVSAIEVAGVNIRLAWVLLPIAAWLIRRGPKDHFWTQLTLAMVAIHVLAGLFSAAPAKGFAYAGWFLFNFLLLFRAGVNASRVLGKDVWNVVILNGRIQIIASLLLVAIGVHDRAQFIYYEASYMAIGLIPYVFASIHLSKSRWLDFTLMALLLAGNQSANQALVLGIAIILWVFQEGLTGRTFAVLVSIPLLGWGLVLQALADPKSANYNIVKYVFDTGITFELIKVAFERGGNRVPRVEAAFEIARDFPFLGLGPGNYIDYSATRDFSHIHGGLWWLEPGGLPAVNVVVEASTNAGVIASVLLLVAFGTLFLRALRHADDNVRGAIVGALIAIGVTLQLESNYLRAYLWIAFGIFVGQLWSGRRTWRVRSQASVPAASGPARLTDGAAASVSSS